MSKITLHTIKNQDADFFDVCYDSIKINFHMNIQSALICNSMNYPLINLSILSDYVEEIKTYLQSDKKNKLVLIAFLEGNSTILYRLEKLKIETYVNSNQIIIISSGNLTNGIGLNVDYFLNLTGNNVYNQIISANNFERIYSQPRKPYKFLYLNKRPRDHRTKLLQRLKESGILSTALWSNLSDDILLPDTYKDYYNKQLRQSVINDTTHDDSWPCGLLVPELYIDTYFSVVSETNFNIPVSYRTEKIYKPILMGHPFVVASNYHFYQDLKNLGFKTFNGLIDESFDNILDNSDRMSAIVDTIKYLSNENLIEFLKEAKPICQYNREHYLELVGKDVLTKYNLLTNFFNVLTNA